MSDAVSRAVSFFPSLAASALALLLAACASQVPSKPAANEPPPQESKRSAPAAVVTPQSPAKAQTELANGIASYEDGAYKQADRQLQNALNQGLETGSDQAKAHKYLAFIYCGDGRKKLCAAEFAKAFAADRNFALTPAEAGHPIWGPVFRSQKAAFLKKAK